MGAGCIAKLALQIWPVPLQTRTLNHYTRATIVDAARRLQLAYHWQSVVGEVASIRNVLLGVHGHCNCHAARAVGG